jgi:hypothetical protein
VPISRIARCSLSPCQQTFKRINPTDYHLPFFNEDTESDRHLRFCPRAARSGTVRVSTELQHLIPAQLQRLLAPSANLHQSFLACAIAALARLTRRPRPQTDAEEGLAHVDHDTHDLVIGVGFEGLADGCELGVQPELVDVDALFVSELIGPFAAVFVLDIFPFRAHALFEKVVVGFMGQLRAGGDVVLSINEGVCQQGRKLFGVPLLFKFSCTYVDAPKFFDRVEGHNLLE